MTTLEHLISEHPQLQLSFLQPGQATRYCEVQVSEVVYYRPDTESSGTQECNPGVGALIRVPSPAQLSCRSATRTHNGLIQLASQRKAAGLIFHVQDDNENLVPESSRALANRLGVPLLLTSAPEAAWNHINQVLQRQRTLFAERQSAHLDGLLRQLPARLADQKASQRIADWLATALQANVLVASDQRGVIAAAPDSASDLLTDTVFARHQIASTNDPASEESSGRYVRVAPITAGAADEAFLAVSAPKSLDCAATRLIQHAAKLLGLCDQARREHRARVEAPRSVRHATFQLLMAGETVLAQVIYTGGSKGLLDTDTARVYVVDTGRQERETTLQWCETTLAEMALVTPCPGKPKHILILDPGRKGNRVETALKKMVSAREGLVMGQSQSHPLTQTAASYMEALSAVAEAVRNPERISLGRTGTKFAHLLPEPAAHAWAQDLMAPLLDGPPSRKVERDQLLKTLRIALGFRLVEAADALQVHRNTVSRRLNQAGQLLGLDLRNSVNNRILVLLALDILTVPSLGTGLGKGEAIPDFADLFAAQPTADAVRSWAKERLGTIQASPRNVIETLCVWMENNLNLTDTATALNLSKTSVRNHLRDASLDVGVDFTMKAPDILDTDVMTIADVGLALHVLLGRPQLCQPRKDRTALIDAPAGMDATAAPGACRTP